MSALATLYPSTEPRDPEGLRSSVAQCLHTDAQWHVAHPVNTLRGAEEVLERFLLPLQLALPDLECKPFIHVPGVFHDQHWTVGTGYLMGTFTRSLFGIPPTGRVLYLRYTELTRYEGDAIAECYLIPDFLDAMAQAGCYPLRPALGYSGLVMPPSTMDGRCTEDRTPSYSAASIELVMDMLDCLRSYDGERLESMELEKYWHPDFMWFGPGGIGTTRGIEGFRAHHQGPFLNAFPDRDVDHHACTVACGDYVATGGWPHMHGTHSGGGWLGLPPSGRHLELRVMDIWRREGDLLRENWVAIDIPQMLFQMGVDVFEQMHAVSVGARA